MVGHPRFMGNRSQEVLKSPCVKFVFSVLTMQSQASTSKILKSIQISGLPVSCIHLIFQCLFRSGETNMLLADCLNVLSLSNEQRKNDELWMALILVKGFSPSTSTSRRTRRNLSHQVSFMNALKSETVATDIATSRLCYFFTWAKQDCPRKMMSLVPPSFHSKTGQRHIKPLTSSACYASLQVQNVGNVSSTL